MGELYPIGERQVRKVITGKLYDTEGRRVEQIITRTGRAYEGDPVDWNKEAKEAGETVSEDIVYKVTNKEGPDTDLPLVDVQLKVKDIQPVEVTVPKTKYFLRLAGQSPQPIVRVTINKEDPFCKQLIQQVATSEVRTEIYKQLGVELTTTKGGKGESSLEPMDESILEESGLLTTRLLGVSIKEEITDEGYVPHKTRKMTKALAGKPIQMKKRIREKVEINSVEVVDLCSSDEGVEESEEVCRASTTTVKQKEEEEEKEGDKDDDDDAEYTNKEDSSDDDSEEEDDDVNEFGIKGLKQIYEEHFVGEKEQKMDTTKETEGAEGSKQAGKAEPKLMIKVRKSEKPKVAAQGVPPHEPPMMRRRASGTMLEKTLGECLLASFEKLEAEEVEKVKEIAAKAKTTLQPKARSKSRETPPMKMTKIQDPEYMETEDIEGPASGQITPGEVSVITDVYMVNMSMEEINLRNVLLELKKWKLDNLDEIYDMLNHHCEL